MRDGCDPPTTGLAFVSGCVPIWISDGGDESSRWTRIAGFVRQTRSMSEKVGKVRQLSVLRLRRLTLVLRRRTIHTAIDGIVIKCASCTVTACLGRSGCSDIRYPVDG